MLKIKLFILIFIFDSFIISQPSFANLSDIKCQVALPASEATLAAARLSLLSAEKTIPKAKKRVEMLSKEIENLEKEIKNLKLNEKDNIEKIKDKELLYKVAKNSQLATLKSLDLSRKALPKAINSVKKAEEKVLLIRKDCEK
jgi:hypothetical protein